LLRAAAQPDDDLHALLALLTRDDLQLPVAIDIGNADVMGPRGADLVAPPVPGRRVAVRERVLIPFHSVIRVPVGDDEIEVAVAVHVDEPGVAAPLAGRGDLVSAQVDQVVPDQRPAGAAGHDQLIPAVAVQVPDRLDVGVLGSIGVNDHVFEHVMRPLCGV